MSAATVSVIIVNHNTRDLTVRCIRSVLASSTCIHTQIIIVDNASGDGSVEEIENLFPSSTVVKNGKNVGFSKAVNQGIKRATGKYIVLLNSDLVLDTPFALERLVITFDSDPTVAVVGGMLSNPDGSLQLSAWKFPNILVEFVQRVVIYRILPKLPFYNKGDSGKWAGRKEVDWVTGAFMGIRKEALTKAGLLDEFFFMYYEDTDICYRIKQRGWKVLYDSAMTAIHDDAQTRKKNPGPIYVEARRSQYYYYKKHCGLVQAEILRCIVLLVTTGKFLLAKCATFGCNSGNAQERASINKKVLQEILKGVPNAHSSYR